MVSVCDRQSHGFFGVYTLKEKKCMPCQTAETGIGNAFGDTALDKMQFSPYT